MPNPDTDDTGIRSQIELVQAYEADSPVLANLLQLYIHDFTSFTPVELGDDGRFLHNPLPEYWEYSDRYAFLIKAHAQLAGFALIRRGSQISGDPNVWDMGDFFIARGFRRRTIGSGAAQAIWTRFPGAWEVRVIDSNRPAVSFWAHAIAEYTGERIEAVSVEMHGAPRLLFRFHAQAR